MSTRIFPLSISEIAASQKFVDNSETRAALISGGAGVVFVLAAAIVSVVLKRADIFLVLSGVGVLLAAALFLSRKKWVENPVRIFHKELISPAYKPFCRELFVAGFTSASENIAKVSHLLCDIISRDEKFFASMEQGFHFEVCSLLRLARLKTHVGSEPELKGLFGRLEKMKTEVALTNLKVIQKRLEALELIHQTALEFSSELRLQKIECSNFIAVFRKGQKLQYDPHSYLASRKERISKLSGFVNRLEKIVLVDGLPNFEPMPKETSSTSPIVNNKENTKEA